MYDTQVVIIGLTTSDTNNQIEVISRDLGIKKSELIRQLIHIGMENISGKLLNIQLKNLMK